MKIITQISMFDYSEIEILGDLERCKLLIDNVPDEKIVQELFKVRGKGRNDYPIIPMWNSLLILPLVECSSVEQLRRELSRNRDLRKICGFQDSDYYYGKCKLVPPPKAYSNLMKNLKKIEPMLKKCFEELREYLYLSLKDFGKEVGEDGKIFSSKAKHPATSKETDERSETEADFTFKEHYYKDSDGITKSKKTKYFGFRVHILGDVNYELPIEYTVTKASKSEREELKNHIKMLPLEKREKIETLSADKGYDGKSTIDFLKNQGISPVIDICNHWEKGETTKQYKNTDLIYTYDGKVSLVLENGESVPLKYLGYDKEKDKLRYGYQKKVYSIEVSYDTRVFTPIARDSKKWKRIYNKRTALERINGRLDRDFNLENHKVRGLKKATVMIDIMMIGMLAMAKGHIENKHPENIRKLKNI